MQASAFSFCRLRLLLLGVGVAVLLPSCRDKATDLAVTKALTRAHDAHEHHDDDNALKYYDEAIQLDPDCANAYGSRATIYAEVKQDYDRAIADYSEAIRLRDDQTAQGKYLAATVYTGRGHCYLHMAKVAEAIADYDEAIRLNPQVLQAYAYRGLAYETKGLYDKAIADYTEAIARTSDRPLYYKVRARVYRAAKQEAKALKDERRARQLERE
ncbi:MAG TPA: tetratricopeptide repeat protein [Gemmataceae bacterium]|nr:tetratricopeptide repeat protein [Gemmataceae bacterium]